MLKLAVLGAGRMAREIVQVVNDQVASDKGGCKVSGIWGRKGDTISGIAVSERLPDVLDAADVAIDFTLASATTDVIQQSVAKGKALVCGVSGLDDSQMQQIASASQQIPLLYDRNMSYGIAVLTRLLQQLGPAFSTDFATEIHETHHRHKIDAPSGTALLLGESLAASRNQRFEDVCHYDPAGETEADQDAIRFFVTREGNVPGDHTVVFRNANETVTLSHSVADRRVFAEGAVKAALWLARQSIGRYRMVDVLVD